MLAEPFTGDDPFVVVFPDDLHVCEPPLTHQLIDTYERTCCSVLAVEHDPPHLERYGVVALAADGCTSPALWRSRPRAPSRAATSPSGGTCIRPRSTVLHRGGGGLGAGGPGRDPAHDRKAARHRHASRLPAVHPGVRGGRPGAVSRDRAIPRGLAIGSLLPDAGERRSWPALRSGQMRLPAAAPLRLAESSTSWYGENSTVRSLGGLVIDPMC